MNKILVLVIFLISLCVRLGMPKLYKLFPALPCGLSRVSKSRIQESGMSRVSISRSQESGKSREKELRLDTEEGFTNPSDSYFETTLITFAVIAVIGAFYSFLGFWELMVYDDSIFHLLSPLFYFPFGVQKILMRINDIKQKIYDFIFSWLLDTPVLGVFIRFWHRALFAFRHYSLRFFDQIERFMELNVFMLFLVIFLSRLHLVGYLVAICILFLRLDFAVLAMARFYKRFPHRLDTLYPKPSQRFMWSHATRIAQEAASNPKVQAVGVAVAGAVAWKVLDVYDTQAAKEIAEADRVETRADRAESRRQAEATRAEMRADREASGRQAEADRAEMRADREAENVRAAADRAEFRRQAEATLAEMRADREDENRRHALDVASQDKKHE